MTPYLAADVIIDRPDRPSSIIAPNRRTTISAKTKMSTSAGSRSAGPSGSICRPSSVAPRTGNHEKEIGDGAAGDLTIESCGRLPLHRPGRSSRSSRSDGIAPPSLARACEGSEYG